jgi:hypothetical protein
MKRLIAVGVPLVAALLLAGCTASEPPLPPDVTSTPAPAVAPSTEVISETEVDSIGFERNTEAENQMLSFASLGDVPSAEPEPGALSFPDYAEESGATVPTAEYALNLTYWGCDQAKQQTGQAENIQALVESLYAKLPEVTGYAAESRQANVYSELMFRGMSLLCEPVLTPFDGYTPKEGAE